MFYVIADWDSILDSKSKSSFLYFQRKLKYVIFEKQQHHDNSNHVCDLVSYNVNENHVQLMIGNFFIHLSFPGNVLEKENPCTYQEIP